MKKILLVLTALLAVVASFAPTQAQPVVKVKGVAPAATGASGLTAGSHASRMSVQLPYNISNFYQAGDTDNFYMMFSDSRETTYDGASGTVDAHDCFVLYLDLYAEHADAINLPTGEYTPDANGGPAGTYGAEYSYLARYDADGKPTYFALEGNVTIKKYSDGDYEVDVRADGQTYSYVGRIAFSSSGNAFVYDQINADIVVDETYKTGLGNYEGNLFQSKTGNMYINLYNVGIDTETGAMNGPGFDIAISAFHRLFSDPKKAVVVPGVYTMARNFKRETYYPGMELTYMDMTIPFGSYVKQLRPDGKSYYSYITDGTITITQAEDGTYGFEFDCVTADGHTLTGSTSGVTFTINDLSDDKPVAIISTLEDDHELDLDYVKTAYVQQFPDANGCSVFGIAIGLPSGATGTEGDLFRMEFLSNAGSTQLPTGTYELMEENHLYTNLYAPYKLVQGYFNDSGVLIGTRYMHYEEGRYCVMDHLAPIVSGTISVEDLGEGRVKFTIDTYDDADNNIYGTWEGSISPNNILVDGIGDVMADGRDALVVSKLSDNVWLLEGVADSESVAVYSVGGALVARSTGAILRTESLQAGVYVVKAAHYQPVKILKK